MTHKLQVDSVILEFGKKRILQDVYVKCETNKITGLLGRNGSGKTCLMNIIFGTLTSGEKSVRLNEDVLINPRRSPEDMLYLPQFSFIPESLTLKRIFKNFKLDFLEFSQAFTGFGKYYNLKLKYLSGGERRVVEIYIIIKSKTKFCLLDEPFSHIMPIHVNSIKTILLSEKKNKGFLITDHMYKHITDISDDLYVLENGKTWLTDSIEDITAFGYLKNPNE